jgi:hypothetical protein
VTRPLNHKPDRLLQVRLCHLGRSGWWRLFRCGDELSFERDPHVRPYGPNMGHPRGTPRSLPRMLYSFRVQSS